jgi:ankyrin repeat protein
MSQQPGRDDEEHEAEAKEDANVAQAANDGVTPLLEACYKGQLDEVRRLIRIAALAGRSTVNAAGEGGFTPLFVAAGEGHHAVAEALIGKGAVVNRASNNGAPPLLVACQGGHVDVVQLLIVNGANIRQADDGGQTPLFMACKALSLAREPRERERCVEIARLLLNSSVAPAAADLPSLPAITCCGGWTPLEMACKEVHLELVQLLLLHCKLGNDFASEFKSKDGDWLDLLNTALEGIRAVLDDRSIKPTDPAAVVARRKFEIATSLIAQRYPKYTIEERREELMGVLAKIQAGGKKSRRKKTKRRHKTGGKKSRKQRKRATIKGGKRKRRRTRRRR